jgi:hypothetical protein
VFYKVVKVDNQQGKDNFAQFHVLVSVHLSIIITMIRAMSMVTLCHRQNPGARTVMVRPRFWRPFFVLYHGNN